MHIFDHFLFVDEDFWPRERSPSANAERYKVEVIPDYVVDSQEGRKVWILNPAFRTESVETTAEDPEAKLISPVDPCEQASAKMMTIWIPTTFFITTAILVTTYCIILICKKRLYCFQAKSMGMFDKFRPNLWWATEKCSAINLNTNRDTQKNVIWKLLPTSSDESLHTSVSRCSSKASNKDSTTKLEIPYNL